MQLKTDTLKEAIDIVSAVTSSDESIDLEKSSDPPHPTDTPTNMLDILLNGIGGDKTTPDDQDNTATAIILCENEMYQLFLGNDFKMKMQNIKTKLYNCPLDWWKTSAHTSEALIRIWLNWYRNYSLRVKDYWVNWLFGSKHSSLFQVNFVFSLYLN